MNFIDIDTITTAPVVQRENSRGVEVPQVRAFRRFDQTRVTVDGELLAAFETRKGHDGGHARVIAYQTGGGLCHYVHISHRSPASLIDEVFTDRMFSDDFLNNQVWRAVVPVED